MELINQNEDTDTPINRLYLKLYNNYKRCHPFEVKGRTLQNSINFIWRNAKSANKKFEDLEHSINGTIEDMNIKFMQ